MKVRCIEEYVRIIEMVGKDTLFFEVEAQERRRGGGYYHYIYKNERKLPLDMAINPVTNRMEYCSFYVKEKEMIERDFKNEIQYKNGLLIIEDEEFSLESKLYTNIEKDFEIIKCRNDIVVLEKGLSDIPLQAYRLDNLNYLLFSKSNDFCGVLLMNISKREWEEIDKTDCLQRDNDL